MGVGEWQLPEGYSTHKHKHILLINIVHNYIICLYLHNSMDVFTIKHLIVSFEPIVMHDQGVLDVEHPGVLIDIHDS